jgi:transcription initiation factor TFIID subunit 5
MLSSLECAPNGRILASGDISGNIIFWDIESGKAIKRCRGHGKGGIHSLSFSVETSVLVSGGQDGTVRVWDVAVPTDPHKAEAQTAATGGSAGTNRVDAGTGAAVPPASVGAKKKGKETMITPDQLSAFPTKKTPVYKVKFTRMNLIMAAGPFLP